MGPSRRKLLKKPLKNWSDEEILVVVAKVDATKTNAEAALVVEQYMSQGTYRRAKRRVGLLKPKVKSKAKALPPTIVHDAFIDLGDALCGFFAAFSQAQKS